MNNELDIFGKFLIKHFRDNAILKLHTLIEGNAKALALQQLPGKRGQSHFCVKSKRGRSMMWLCGRVW